MRDNRKTFSSINFLFVLHSTNSTLLKMARIQLHWKHEPLIIF
jgi:hypothetical protein